MMTTTDIATMKTVAKAIGTAKERGMAKEGSGIYISDLYEVAREYGYEGSLDSFKAVLQDGGWKLGRPEMPSALDQAKYRASLIEARMARYCFVRV